MLAKIWVILTMGGSSSDTTALSLLPSRSHRGGMPRSSVLVGAGGSGAVCFGGQASAYCGRSQEDAGVAEQRWSSTCVTVTGLCRAAEAGGRKARCPMWVDVNLVHTDILGSVNFWTSSPFHPLPSPPQPQAERSVWMKDFTPSFAGSFVLTIADFVTTPTTTSSILFISYASSYTLTSVTQSLGYWISRVLN